MLDIGTLLLTIAGIVLVARFPFPFDASRYVTLAWIVLTPLIAFMIAFLALPTPRAWIEWTKLRTFRFSLQ